MTRMQSLLQTSPEGGSNILTIVIVLGALFAGLAFVRAMARRDIGSAGRNTVSADEVLSRLTPPPPGAGDSDFPLGPGASAPASKAVAESPLGRVQAREVDLDEWWTRPNGSA